MVKELSSTCRVWVSGNTYVISVPLPIRRIMGIEKGDFLIVDWSEIIKKEDSKIKVKEGKKKTKRELPKI